MIIERKENMQKNKIIVENGRTTIIDNKPAKEPSIKRLNSDLLDEMQAVFDKVEKNSQKISAMGTQENQVNQNNIGNNLIGCNQSGLMSLLPLIAGMGGKNMSNISSIMSNLQTSQNGGGNVNILSQLLPLLQNLKSSNKKQTQNTLSIDSLTKADDN